MKIALISDTHSFLDQKVLDYCSDADEIWHAGDIGKIELIDKIQTIGVVRVVFGNIDDLIIRRSFAEHLFFEVEGLKVLMIHIAGKFASYTPAVRKLITQLKPQVLVCGHSHILKIAFDSKYNLMYINPGAVGISGFHKVRTMLKFEILEGKITNMQVIEMAKGSLKE